MDGTVRAIKVDPKTFEMTFMNEQSTKGGAPCYLSVSKDGKWLFTATYMGKGALMYPILEDGSLGEAKSLAEK